MSELYRKLDCSRYDGYCHGCPAEHLPEGVECQINAMRDEQAERDRDLGAKVREYCEQRVNSLARSAAENPPATVLAYARRWAEFHGSGLGTVIADALEAEEAANAATGH